jgi:Alpha/beta hydrolase family
VAVLIVPGAGVRRYARPAVEALRGRGVAAWLLPAPGGAGGPADLERYGVELARRLASDSAEPVELLVGLSVGAQAAAVAAAVLPPGRLRGLTLVSPTVDPRIRSAPRMLARWLAAGRLERPGLLAAQGPDWRRAGPGRLARVVRSSLRVRLEDVLPRVPVALAVVHGADDVICSHAYAAALADDHGGRLVVVPGATHSWPYADADRFADTVLGLLG